MNARSLTTPPNARPVLDFTGELNRFAVLRATARDTAAVARARDVADAVFGQMLQFDLRNGAARKKFDTLKYTLKARRERKRAAAHVCLCV